MLSDQKLNESNKTEKFSYFSVSPFSSDSDASSTITTLSEGSNSPVNQESDALNKTKEKATNDLDLKKIMDGKDCRTTFMIRNIPNKYTQVVY